MAKLLVLYNPPADPAAFDAHYANVHVPLARKVPGLRSYTLSKGPVATVAGDYACYMVAEVVFDSMEDLQAGVGSPEGQAAIADLANFAQSGVTIMTFDTRDA